MLVRNTMEDRVIAIINSLTNYQCYLMQEDFMMYIDIAKRVDNDKPLSLYQHRVLDKILSFEK